MKRLHELAAKYPRYGYRMTTAKLRQEGCRVNFKRIQRLRRQEGLKVPQKSVKSDVSVTTVTVACATRRSTRTTSGLGTSSTIGPPLASR